MSQQRKPLFLTNHVLQETFIQIWNWFPVHYPYSNRMKFHATAVHRNIKCKYLAVLCWTIICRFVHNKVRHLLILKKNLIHKIVTKSAHIRTISRMHLSPIPIPHETREEKQTTQFISWRAPDMHCLREVYGMSLLNERLFNESFKNRCNWQAEENKTSNQLLKTFFFFYCKIFLSPTQSVLSRNKRRKMCKQTQ